MPWADRGAVLSTTLRRAALTVLTLSPKVGANVEAVTGPVAASLVSEARVGLGSVAAQAGGGGSQPATPVKVYGAGKGATIARWAQAQAGKGYQFGATGPHQFDCSGLVLRAALQVGVKLPRTAAQQFGHGRRITRSQLLPGDLVFWSNGKGISHVAVSLGGNRIVAATNPRRGVVVGTIYGTPAGYRRIV